MPRQVKYYGYERAVGTTKDIKIFKSEATFHEFGVSYEEFESGPGNYSTAIIELPDGTVKNVPVEDIEFI